MSTTQKKGGSKVKSARAQRAEFDRVLKALEEENKVLETTAGHKVMFAGSAVSVAALPVFLYARGIFETTVQDHALLFAFGFLAAANVLFHIYDKVATNKRNVLIVESRSNRSAEDDSAAMEKAANVRSGYYSLFAVNSIYLTLFLFSVLQLLPVYELSHPVNFVIASLIAAGAVAGSAAVRLV